MILAGACDTSVLTKGEGVRPEPAFGTMVAMPSRTTGCPGRRCAFLADGRAKKGMEYRATPADRPSWLVRLLWMAAVILGASAGIYLAQIRASRGTWAAKAVLNSWRNLPP